MLEPLPQNHIAQRPSPCLVSKAQSAQLMKHYHQYQALKKAGKYREAIVHAKKALELGEREFGPKHKNVGTFLNNLAALYEAQGRYLEAEPLYKRSLTIREAALGKNHPDVATTLNNLAFLHFGQRDWRRAARYWRGATGVLTRRAERGGKIGPNKKGQRVRGKKKTEVAQNSWYFTGLVKATYRDEASRKNGREMFLSAQWAIGSQAAGALAQMSARQAAGSGELANMVRERQDAVREWQKNEKRMNALRGAGKSDKKLEADMARLDKRIGEIDKRLAKDFPDYAALASPKPLAVSEVQKLLGADEALILLLDTPKSYSGGKLITPAETFVWAVTRDKAIWKRAPLGGKTLSRKIALLRKELDPSTATRSAKTKRGFRPTTQSAGFDLATAHELYTKLPGPIEDVIADKSHLMVVGSGPLTALPFQVLVKTNTNSPDGVCNPVRNFQANSEACMNNAGRVTNPARPAADVSLSGNEKYQKADWLIRHHAITTLPSVASLKALRGIGQTASKAPEPLIGFADPVFSRSNSEAVAHLKSQIPAKPVKVASNRGYASFFRGRSADLASLSGLAPLPGTRRELREVGKILNVQDKHLHYGSKASEGAVRQARLDQFRIVYFATHGLISGDVEGLGEPALAFSLPAKATTQDDGLLTASEVTELKLNADWLVMSACDTASGDKPGAEALSGLARAFFYAGAKTLLVSHWPVGDEAAVALTTHAFKNMQDNPELGKSQALRQSMLAMIDKGKLANAHPRIWAPFVVVGEGAQSRLPGSR